ncbi:aldehyde dehydrogenase [Aspergillus heteromorphus CBS 117.55]|uniref:aldehyde dehydrogenase (NAD(+)) n=1 Tax=Aspergillus heteromorphus CBS 117.55 TaxID=1448321 RepID=A0A317VIK7_9EURO|nr:aldehyde dehydrogenase [Aspergillus heteromorphus CBS 117.55]PWY73027.1 aldehyde dehydrogenase [Aspergillus heteromorphus CBS 117.55]
MNFHTKEHGDAPQYPGKPEAIEDRLFINGEFVPSKAGKKFDVYNPATEKVSASVYEADADDVDLAVQAAKAAFPAWSELSALERGHYLERWADALEKSLPEISYLDAISMGKPAYPDPISALAPMIPMIVRFFASKALDVTGESSLNTANFINISLRQPYGVCGAITPWNAPVMFLVYKTAAALITGNTMVLKSSEKAPLSSLTAARCAQEAGIPKGVFNVVSGLGRPCGEAIARHMEIRKISFTGSTATGRAIQKISAESNLKSVTLELGGKSPLIIWDDADLAKAVPAAAMSILMNTGQVCNASTRIYIHSAVADHFLDSLQATMKLMGASGDPLTNGTMRGPQADKAQFERVLSYLDEARESAEVTVTLGGNKEEGRTGYFIQPTILTNVPEDSRLVKEEIFGPVLIVNTFSDEEDVLRKANDTEYGLYSSIFTRDISRALRAAKRLEAGTVAINCTSPTLAFDMPFGGWKGSGEGREFSRYATDYWTELKSVYMAL